MLCLYVILAYAHYASRVDGGYVLGAILVFIPFLFSVLYAQLVFYGERRKAWLEWVEALFFSAASLLAGGVYGSWPWRDLGWSFWFFAASIFCFATCRRSIAAALVSRIRLQGTDAMWLFQFYPPRGRGDMRRVTLVIFMLMLMPLFVMVIH